MMTKDRDADGSLGPPPSKRGEPNSRHVWVLAALAAMVVLGLWFVWGYRSWPPSSGDAEFGDSFGALNALFSGFAFLGVIVAVLLQREELKVSREELRVTNDELKRQADALQVQNETTKKLNFENTFFQLLRALNDIVESIDIQGKQTIRARDCMKLFFERLRGYYAAHQYEPDEAIRIQLAYMDFYNVNQSDVGHYFRTLYNIIKFVDQSDVNNKVFYTNLVRAQLSSHELLLLFYNAQSSLGREKFKPLIERYGLLKTVPRELLFNPAHEALYDAAAFRSAARE